MYVVVLHFWQTHKRIQKQFNFAKADKKICDKKRRMTPQKNIVVSVFSAKMSTPAQDKDLQLSKKYSIKCALRFCAVKYDTNMSRDVKLEKHSKFQEHK